MAITTTITIPCHFETPLIPKPSLLTLIRNPNPRPVSVSLRLSSTSSSSRGRSGLGFCSPGVARCSAGGGGGGGGDHGGDYEHERVVYARPPEIPWRKELANSVHLIGVVGAPVQIKHLSSGKVLAWTRLGVKKSPTDTTWINLTLWDELAHVAFQHIEKGQQIYVSGRLVSDTVEGGDDEKRQIYYKVVVQQLNFIERSFPPVSLYEPETSSVTTGAKLGNYIANHGSSAEELWQAFFANPVDWWDNRKNKRNPKYPDFKHKHTGEALWIEGKYNPPWVKSQLAILDSRMGSLHANEVNPVSFMYGDDLTPF